MLNKSYFMTELCKINYNGEQSFSDGLMFPYWWRFCIQTILKVKNNETLINIYWVFWENEVSLNS
jgi:hypothetical protein